MCFNHSPVSRNDHLIRLAIFVQIFPLQLFMANRGSYTRALAAFYYGSLSRPSGDPARIGFLSTVPPNAGELLSEDVKLAKEHHHDLPSMLSQCSSFFDSTGLTNPDSDIEANAPVSLPPLYGTGIGGVPLASPIPVENDGTSGAKNGISRSARVNPRTSWGAWISAVTLTLWTTVG